MRKLNVTIYRFALGDCTNNGASSRHDSMTAFDGDIVEIIEYVESHNIDKDACLYLVKGEFPWAGVDDPYFIPLEYALSKPKGNLMVGGNYCCGDSRWKEWFGHHLPIRIHDRLESWEQYERMSR